ncbi:MAG: zinc ribbon domain-containing protein [Candidatus Methanoplasma sp.]|jgi:ribosomal protein L40E|nr:zinc ribbon domain-containing protein [Candidatus Methanoplasma sp.]
MNNTSGAKAIDLKWFGTLSLRQLLGVIVAFAFALLLTLLGFGASCSCFGMLIIAVILFMLPRMMGVENIKLMSLVGAVFAASAVLIGGMVLAPSFVETNVGSPSDNDFFTYVEYEYTDNGITITATLVKDAEYMDGKEVYFRYGEVVGVGFGTMVNGVLDKKTLMTVTGGTVSGSVSFERDKLYTGGLILMEKNDSGDEVMVGGSNTALKFFTESYDGSIVKLCLYGCLIGILYIILIFFMIMIFSNLMRTRMEKARERMEKEGRLYPQGHGRCGECGSVVLPGEVNCRKCGAYIDRPDEMKPQKKDFFDCTECNAEVSADAKVCPKCGAVFDEEETEVTHADGTVERSKDVIICKECNGEVPAASAFCVRCGAKIKGRR